MALNLAPVNFGAATEPNAMAQIGQALSQYPTDVASSQLQNQQIGQQLLAPYLKMLKANQDLENNPRFMGTINNIAKQYDIPIPTVGDQSDSTPAPEAQGTPPAQPGTTPPAVQGSAQPPPPNAAMTMAPATQVPQLPTPAIPGVVPGAQATQPVPASPTPPPPVTQNSVGQTMSAGATQTAPPAKTSGGGPRIDPTWLIGDMNPDLIAKAQSMDPEQRKQFLRLQGIDSAWLPKGFLNAPQQITPGEKAAATTAFAKEIEGVAEGRNTADSITAIGDAYRPILGDAVVDSALNNPQNLTRMGNALVLQFDKYRQSGFWKQKDYDAAMARVNAMIGRNATYKEYVEAQDSLIPKKAALMDAQAKHALADAQAAHTRLAASAATSGLTRGQIASQYAQALRSYNTLHSQIGRASYYKDPLTGRPEKTAPPDEMVDAAQDAGDDLDYWTDQMHEAGMPVKPRTDTSRPPRLRAISRPQTRRVRPPTTRCTNKASRFSVSIRSS